MASFRIRMPFPRRPEMGTIATGGAVWCVALPAHAAMVRVAVRRTLGEGGGGGWG